MNPLVSVVIPCYNDANYIEKAISSVLSQTYKNIEIIVVDDGSDELTKSVLERIKDKFSLLIKQNNQGVVKARNEGIQKAKGDYIVNLDADDFLEPDFVLKAVRYLEQNISCGVVSSNYSVFNKSGFDRKVYLDENKITLKDFLLENRISSNALFRKKCWEEIKGYDELFVDGYEDWDFWINIVSNGWKIKIINEFLLNIFIKDRSRNRLAMKLDEVLREKIVLKYSHLYKEIFEEFIEFQFETINQLKKTIRKRDQSVDMKIGRFLLWPLRKIKRFF